MRLDVVPTTNISSIDRYNACTCTTNPKTARIYDEYDLHYKAAIRTAMVEDESKLVAEICVGPYMATAYRSSQSNVLALHATAVGSSTGNKPTHYISRKIPLSLRDRPALSI